MKALNESLVRGDRARRGSRAPLVLCIAAVLAVSTAVGGEVVLAASAKAPDRVLDVTVESGRLSVRAQDAPLVDVLEAIGRHAGLPMVLGGDLNTPVTATLVAVPLDEGVRRLSRWHSVVLIYDRDPDGGQGATLSEIWVTESSASPTRGGSTEQQTARVEPRHEARAVASRPSVERRDPFPGFTTLLRHRESVTRRRAIEALVRERGPHATMGLLLEAATGDPDPRVRRGAVQALASMNDPAVAEAVRATLRDADPGVRSEAQMALRRLTRVRPRDGSIR